MGSHQGSYFQPINRLKPTKSLGINTEYKPRAVVWLVSIFNCLEMIGLWKMNERSHDMTPNTTLLVHQQRKKTINERYKKHLIFVKLHQPYKVLISCD